MRSSRSAPGGREAVAGARKDSHRATGTILARRFRILEALGNGGMGEVLVAEDLLLGRRVAVKRLPSERGDDPDARVRLEAEARLLATLSHPRIAALYDLCWDGEDGLLVMEYVSGCSLRRRLREGPVALAEAVDLTIEVASALDHAHRRGLLHCDVKPSNIVLAEDGSAKLLDFGLARWRDRSGSGSRGPVCGTRGYLAPELLEGAGPDAQSDLFSLGVVLYEMVAGRLPFGSDASYAARLLREEPRSLSAFRAEVPVALETVCRRALLKPPDRRYATAREMLTDLEALRARLSPPPTGARFERTPTRLPPGGFRGLLPFQEADRSAFFGREREAKKLLAMVTHQDFRVGVLFGPSGSGKTSLLRAALMPSLREAGYLPIYVSSFRAGPSSLVESCRRETGLRRGTGKASSAGLEQAARAVGGCGLVILLDQFETLFVGTEDPEAWLSLVAGRHDEPRAPMRFLLVVREDFLHVVSTAFQDAASDPLQRATRFRLGHFDAGQAVEILERSAASGGLPFEAGLAAVVARDLERQGVIAPSELQLVGELLERRRIFTKRLYRSSGGRDQLVHDYLDEVVGGSGEVQVTWQVLECLISEQGTAEAPTLEELAERSGVSTRHLSRILGGLVLARVVEVLAHEAPPRYRLVHEYLIGPIRRLGGSVLGPTHRANRRLRRYVAEAELDPESVIPARTLWTLWRHLDRRHRALGQALLRRSLRQTVVRGAATLALTGLVALGLAALLSIREIWDGDRLFEGHAGAVRQLALAPRGGWLASVGEDGRLVLWDLDRQMVHRTVTTGSSWVQSVVFAPDASWIATGGTGGTVVWKVPGLEPIARFEDPEMTVHAMAASSDGRLLFGGGVVGAPLRGVGVLWRTDTWNEIARLPFGLVWGSVSFGGADAWLTRSGDLGRWHLRAHASAGSAGGPACSGNWTTWSRDGSFLVSVDPEGFVAFCADGGSRLLDRVRAHRDHGRSTAISPDGRWAASGAEDIVLWDLARRQIVQRFRHESIVWSLAFTADSRRLLSSHADGSVLLWDLAMRKLAGNLSGHAGAVAAVDISPDESLVASGGEDGSVVLWDLVSRRKRSVLRGHGTTVNGLAFAPDGRSLVSCDQNGRHIRWDIETGRMVWVREPPSWRPCYAIAISPDGSVVVSTEGIFGQDGRRLGGLESRVGGSIYTIAFSDDGRWLAVGDDYGELRLYSGPRLEETAVAGHPASILALAFGPDGRHLVTADGNGEIWRWRVEPLGPDRLLGRHTGSVGALSARPGSYQVASAGSDGVVALWDIRRGRRVGVIASERKRLLATAFSSSGGSLAVVGSDGEVHVFSARRTLWGRSPGEAEVRAP